MSTTKKVSDFASALASTLKGAVKIVLQSRVTRKPAPAKGESVVILANGPSLRGTVDTYGAVLRRMPALAVNFFANTPEFTELKPAYYVLADPHFFRSQGQANVESLWRNLAAASWPLSLSVPACCRKEALRRLGPDARNVTLATFNFVGVEGFVGFERFAYSHGLAMPRPRNVLLPALMTAMRAGFTRIYITGADHSWLGTVQVNDRNEVVSVQPHFYADSKAETTRSVTEYKGYRLHDILRSFYVAFESYHRLQRYARARGINIVNATPGSFIDAFERGTLDEIVKN